METWTISLPMSGRTRDIVKFDVLGYAAGTSDDGIAWSGSRGRRNVTLIAEAPADVQLMPGRPGLRLTYKGPPPPAGGEVLAVAAGAGLVPLKLISID